MADQLVVTIVGKDGVSRIFQDVSKNAAKMGADVAQASEKSSRSLKDFSNAGKEVGAGIGLLGASFTMFAQSTATNERNIATLSRTFGDATKGLVEYANQIQATTTYSNDAAIAAENIFASLARNYGLTVDQVKQLTSVSTDLAATSGLALEDVATRVAAAIRGEGEAAEALGLTMNQQSIDREGLTLSMTNQEAAQFRLNALYSQTAAFEGAAADQAATTTGQVKQLANSFQDAAQGIVEFSGPIGEAAAGIGSFGVEAGVAIGGIVSLGKGINSLVQEAGGIKGVVTSLGAMSSILGPAALVGALGLAAYGAYELAQSFGDDLDAAMQEVNASADTLDDTIASLTATMSNATVANTLFAGGTELDKIKAELDEYAQLVQTWQDIPTDRLTLDTSNLDQETIDSIQRQKDALAQIAALEAKYGDATTALQSLTETQDAYTQVLSHQGAGADDAQQSLVNLVTDLENGAITYEEFAAGVELTAQQLSAYDEAALAAAAATEHFATVTAAASTAASDLLETTRSHTEILSSSEAQTLASAEAMAAYTARVEENQQAWRDVSSAASTALEDERSHTTIYSNTADAIVKVGEASDRSQHDVEALAISGAHASVSMATMERGTRGFVEAIDNEKLRKMGDFVEIAAAKMDAFNDKAIDMAQSFGALSTNAKLFDAAGLGGQSVDVAVNLQVGGAGVDAVFGAIKQAQALSSQLEGVDSWADTLIGDPGVWAQADQLLADGRISLEQYNAAQEAQVSISADVTNAQQDLLAVQANLAPVMADAVHQQAQYIDSLQGMSDAEQLAALGFMDQAKSAQVLEIAQLAAAASTDTMKAQTSDMIIQMAQADPVLKSMLESMGLISETDGVITVDFSAAEGADDAITELTSSIDALIAVLGGVPPLHFDLSEATLAKDQLDALKSSADDIPNDILINPTMTDNDTEARLDAIAASGDGINPNIMIDVEATDNATGKVLDVHGKVTDLDSLTGTATADADNTPATTAIGVAMADLGDWGARSASATVGVVDLASGTLGAVNDLLNAIDGRQANSYVNTHYTVSGTSGFTPELASNGGILGYANGGMVLAGLSENGPELLRFANGGQAIVPNPGIYAVEVGTSVLPAPATKAVMQGAGRGGNGGNFFYGPVTFRPSGSDAAEAISQSIIRRGRG